MRNRTIVQIALWISVAAAICVAISITGRIAPLWFFIIPLLATKHVEKEGGEDDGRD